MADGNVVLIGGDFAGALLALLVLLILAPLLVTAIAILLVGLVQHRHGTPEDRAWRRRAGVKTLVCIVALVVPVQLPMPLALLSLGGLVWLLRSMQAHNTTTTNDQDWWRTLGWLSGGVIAAGLAAGFLLGGVANASTPGFEATSMRFSPSILHDIQCQIETVDGETSTVWRADFLTSTGYETPQMRPTLGVEFIDVSRLELGVTFVRNDGSSLRVTDSFPVPRFADQVVRGELMQLELRAPGEAMCQVPSVKFLV